MRESIEVPGLFCRLVLHGRGICSAICPWLLFCRLLALGCACAGQGLSSTPCRPFCRSQVEEGAVDHKWKKVLLDHKLKKALRIRSRRRRVSLASVVLIVPEG